MAGLPSSILRLFPPLVALLEEPTLRRLVIAAGAPVWLETASGGRSQGVRVDEAELEAAVRVLAEKAGKVFDETHPWFEAVLRDGSRFVGVRPPVADTLTLVVERPGRVVAAQVPQAARAAMAAVWGGANTIFTGLGDDPLAGLRLLLGGARVIEVGRPPALLHPATHLVPQPGTDGPGLGDCLRLAGRMAAERALVPTLRTVQAWDLVATAATRPVALGLALAANDAGGALARLEAMARQGAGPRGDAVPGLIRAGFDRVVCIGAANAHGERTVEAVVALVGDAGRPELQAVWPAPPLSVGWSRRRVLRPVVQLSSGLVPLSAPATAAPDPEPEPDAPASGAAPDVDQEAQTRVRIVESDADASEALQPTRVARVEAEGDVEAVASDRALPQRAGNDASMGPRTVRADVAPAMSLGPAPVPPVPLSPPIPVPMVLPFAPSGPAVEVQLGPDPLAVADATSADEDPPTRDWRRVSLGASASLPAADDAPQEAVVEVAQEGDFDSVDLPASRSEDRAGDGSREDRGAAPLAPVVDLAALALGSSSHLLDDGADATTGLVMRVGNRAPASAPHGASLATSDVVVDPGSKVSVSSDDGSHRVDGPDELPVDFDYAHAVAATLDASLNVGVEPRPAEQIAGSDLDALAGSGNPVVLDPHAVGPSDADTPNDADCLPDGPPPAGAAEPRAWPTGGEPLRARPVRDIDSADFSDLAADPDLMGHFDGAPSQASRASDAIEGSVAGLEAAGLTGGVRLLDEDLPDDDEATREINLRTRAQRSSEASGNSRAISTPTLGIPRPVGRSRAPAESPAPRAVWDPRGSVRGEFHGRGGLPAVGAAGVARVDEPAVELKRSGDEHIAQIVLTEVPAALDERTTGGPDEITADRDDLVRRRSEAGADGAAQVQPDLGDAFTADHRVSVQARLETEGLDVDLSGSEEGDVAPAGVSDPHGVNSRQSVLAGPEGVHDFGRIVSPGSDSKGDEAAESDSAEAWHGHSAVGDHDRVGRLGHTSESPGSGPRGPVDRGTVDFSPIINLDDTSGLGPEFSLGESVGRPVEIEPSERPDAFERPVGRSSGGVLDPRPHGISGLRSASGSERSIAPNAATAEPAPVNDGRQPEDEKDGVDELDVVEGAEAKTQALEAVSLPPSLDEPLHALLRSLGADDASSLDDDEDDESTTMVTDLHNVIAVSGGVDRRSFSEILRSISGVHPDRLGTDDPVPGRGRLQHNEEDGSEAGEVGDLGDGGEPEPSPAVIERDAHGRVGRHTVVHAESEED